MQAVSTDQIVITASRAPVSSTQTPASVSIIDDTEIERLGEPLVLNLLRLTPSAAVTSVGPAGSLTEVRMRGVRGQSYLILRRWDQNQRSGLGGRAALRAAQRRPRVTHRGRPWTAVGPLGL